MRAIDMDEYEQRLCGELAFFEAENEGSSTHLLLEDTFALVAELKAAREVVEAAKVAAMDSPGAAWRSELDVALSRYQAAKEPSK